MQLIKLAIVIPFHKPNGKFLPGAIQSIFEQTYKTNFCIYIIDDCSPFPAQIVLDELPEEQKVRIKLIKHKKNKGVSGARDTGIRSVDPDFQYLAFLDSDDQWLPDHLEKAFMCGIDWDFYFAGAQRIVEDKCSLELSDRAKEEFDKNKGKIVSITSEYALDHELFPQVSTIIYQLNDHTKNVFFEENLSAYEDILFFFYMLEYCKKIVVLFRNTVNMGVEDNLYFNAHSKALGDTKIAFWLNKNSLLASRYIYNLSNNPSLNSSSRDYYKSWLEKLISKSLSQDFFFNLFHLIAHKKKVRMKSIFYISLFYPSFFYKIFYYLGKAIWLKLYRKLQKSEASS